jgi:cell division transport system ATP-binding protein
MVVFHQTSKYYPGDQEALKAINLHIPKGEMAFLTGHSGAGKSTLLRLIALIERPSQGQLIINGKNTAKISPRYIPWVRRKIGLVFQDHRLIDRMRVFDNVALPLVIAGFSNATIKRRVHAALDKVNLLDSEKRYPVDLSSGEQQRVGIARAIVNRPPLLLADEPTGNLDPELSAEIMSLFDQLHQLGSTILIASHDMALISTMNKRVIRLENGRVANT